MWLLVAHLSSAALLLQLQIGAAAPGGFEDWWKNLGNPIVGYEDWSVKDAYLVVQGETCYAFFSAFYPKVLSTRSHVVGVKGQHCMNWSEPFMLLDGSEGGWLGACSPSVKPLPDGGWVLAYNSWGDKKDQPNQLLYRTSSDLVTWSDAMPLAQSLTSGSRFIDADATFDAVSKQWVLLSKGKIADPTSGKRHTRPKMFLSSSGLDGTWTDLANLTLRCADGSATNSLENWDLFQDGQGVWRILATSTSSTHLPILFTQASHGDFSQWVNGTILELPEQAFNTAERGNAAAISSDLFASTGYYLLIYAGTSTTESLDFAGRGNNKLGIARSKDLFAWEVVPGMTSLEV